MLAVVRTVLLDSIISQVDEVVVQILCRHRVWLRRGPQIPLFEEVHIQVLSQSHPDSNIELSLVDQEWSLNILLNDEGLGADRGLLIPRSVRLAFNLCLGVVKDICLPGRDFQLKRCLRVRCLLKRRH
jgi:hypothetical protein